MEDLIGRKFNHLTVIQYDEVRSIKEKRSYWVCQCDCEQHTTFSVLQYNLKSNNTTKCKYCRADNLTGKTFGRPTVTERVIVNNHVEWNAECECGNTIVVSGVSLRSGHTRSCGCLQKEHASKLNYDDITGQKFGRLTAIKRSDKKDSSGNYYWFCDCSCGTKNHEVNAKNLRLGKTTSCGCVMSKGEEKIAEILSGVSARFVKQHSFDDCIFSSGKPARFDFAVLNTDGSVGYLIEYHGEQHFVSRGKFFTEDRVSDIKKRDDFKLSYCKEHGIPIIYLDYTDYDTLDVDDVYLEKLLY